MTGLVAIVIVVAAVNSLQLNHPLGGKSFFPSYGRLQQSLILSTCVLLMLLPVVFIQWQLDRFLLLPLQADILAPVFLAGLSGIATLGLFHTLDRWLPGRVEPSTQALLAIGASVTIVGFAASVDGLADAPVATLTTSLAAGFGLWIILPALTALHDRVALATAPPLLRGVPLELLSTGMAILGLATLGKLL